MSSPLARSPAMLALALALALAPTDAAAQSDVVLDFAGTVPGDITTSPYVDWIRVLSMSTEAFSRATFDGAGGRTVGPARVRELEVTKYVDRATGPLFTSLIAGTPLADATLHVLKANDEPSLTLTLTSPVVVGVDSSVEAGDDAPAERVTISFTSICVQTYTSDPFGVSTPEPQVCYDVANQAPL